MKKGDLIKTECTKEYSPFQALGRRKVVADFSGGTITSDGGGLLLREVEERNGILHCFAQCFTDHRDQRRIEHSVLSLVPQRVFGLTLGYEDLNDHDQLASDKLLDVDATDDPLYGNQEGKFFHGYYKAYCYLPLYIFCSEVLLCARLRTLIMQPFF